MNAYLLVFIGGGLGSMLRYGISRLVGSSEGGFPTPTLLANAIACIVLGVLMGILFKKGLEPKLQFLLISGFCGGFSTFSTFSAETFLLIKQGNIGMALAYVLVSVILCCLLIFGSFVIANRYI